MEYKKSDFEKEARSQMTKEEAIKCHSVIHTASITAGGVSGTTAQLPFVDSAYIVPAQMVMIIALGIIFGYSLSEGIAQSMIVPIVVSELGKGAAKTLVGVIPVAGNIVKAGISVTFTETLGWLMASQFAEGRNKGLGTDELISNATSALEKMKKIGRKKYKK